MPEPWPHWSEAAAESFLPGNEREITHGNESRGRAATQNDIRGADMRRETRNRIYTTRRQEMIVTTTPTVEGHPVTQYLRVVCGETIAGVNMFKDIAAGFRNVVGGRSQAYENELIQARETALAEMVQRALELGAEGVVGVDIDYETLGTDNGMLMVTASGTAVRFSQPR